MTSDAVSSNRAPPLARRTAIGFLSSLVGREDELSQALSLIRLEDVRLLTLTGPGGIGKTRLLSEIIRRLDGGMAGGAHLVRLESVPHAGLVAETIALELGVVVLRGMSARDALVNVLADSGAVLGLDNLEHLPDAAGLVADLLIACPALKILATSRSPLWITGERVLPVGPLDLPDLDDARSLDRLSRAPSIRLFVDRARGVDPTFLLNELTGASVAAICRHLDGIPLAIELAATQIGVLPPTALLDRIRTGLPLPLDGPVDAPDRLRTMESAIAWSYDLLSREERRLFRCLGIFTDGFGLQAASAVCGHDPSMHDPAPTAAVIASHESSRQVKPDLLPGLALLVNKSLVRRVNRGNEARYAMLAPIRRFAVRQLAIEGELDAAIDAHAAWYLALAERTRHAEISPGGERHLAELELEHGNIRAALDSLSERGAGEPLTRLVLALGGFWYENNHYYEARTWLERTLDKASGATRAGMLVYLGLFLGLQDDDMERAEALIEEGIAAMRETRDPLTITSALIWRGAVAFLRGNLDQAERIIEEAHGLTSDIVDPFLAAALRARALDNLGAVAHERGELSLAVERCEEALRICREQGYMLGMIRTLRDLGDLARDQGDHVRSLAYYRDCVSLLGEESDVRVIADVLEGVALAAVAWKDPERAARLLGAADALCHRIGMPIAVATGPQAHRRIMAATRVSLREHAFEAAWAQGRRMTLQQAVAEVTEIAPPEEDGGTSVTYRAISLSPREKEILRLLVAGHSDREIASALYLSVRTVESHMARLRAKLGVHTRIAVVTTAITAGLVDPELTLPG